MKAIESEIDAHLVREEEGAISSERIDAKVSELMQDRAQVACAIDDIIASSDHGKDGNTLFAGDLADVMMAGWSKDGEFFANLDRKVRDTLRDEAESLLLEEQRQALENHEEQVAEQREASRNFGYED